MKKIFFSLVVIAMGCVASLSAYAFEPMNIPPMADYVVDHAGVLSASDLQSLNQQAKTLETSTSAQIATALIPEHGDYVMLDVGLKLFRDTGLGQKTKNNGLLLLISTSDKKIRIVVGYGLEGEIPDIVARDIIEKSVRPLVNSGDYVGAIQAYYARVQTIILQGGDPSVTASNTTSDSSSKTSSNIVFAVFLVAFIMGNSVKASRRKNTSKGRVLFSAIISLIFFVAGIYILGVAFSLIIYIVGLIFGYVGDRLPGGGFGGFGGGGFGGGGFGGGGGFSGGGGSSGGGGAGD